MASTLGEQNKTRHQVTWQAMESDQKRCHLSQAVSEGLLEEVAKNWPREHEAGMLRVGLLVG